MKFVFDFQRITAILLTIVMCFTSCLSESAIDVVTDMSDPDFAGNIRDLIYSELLDELDPDMYFVTDVESIYLSQEYIEELSYNSKENIFFGYSLSEIDDQFLDSKYVFTLGENGETIVAEFVAYDNTFEQIIKNVAIGTGVILICVTVAVVTKNFAVAESAGRTIKAFFAISTKMAKGAEAFAVSGAAFQGTVATVITGVETGDFSKAIKAGALAASEGYKVGAITGAVTGFVQGIYTIGDTRFFKGGTPQAVKYAEGIRFTEKNGKVYPRFEKYAKATAKFNLPDAISAAEHTGLSGNYYWDAKLANAQCGFSSTPAGYVWHHVEDMMTMILIPQDVHSVAFGGMPHNGGAELIRNLLGL